jgi:CRP/FNR family transcriptional regulator
MLSPAQAAQIHLQMRYRLFRAGDLILQQGQHSPVVFWIHKGSVKVVAGTKDTALSVRREVVLNLRGPGAMLGELNAFDGRGHTANVVALEATKCLMLPTADFHLAIMSVPALSQAVTRYLVDCIRLHCVRHEQMALHNVASVLAGQLLQIADEWGVAQPDGGVILPFPLTQTLLSGLTGHSRERVHRAVGQFEEAGYISSELRHRIAIRDCIALRQIVDGCVLRPAL